MCACISFLRRQPTASHPSLFSVPPPNSLQGFRRYFPVAASPLLFSCKRVTKIGKLRKVNSNANANATEGASYCTAQTPKTEEERFQKLRRAKEKIAQFQVYVQDALGGSNPTVWEVARSPRTTTSPTSFGQVRVTDDLLTVDPDRNSENLGRVQGVISFSDLQQPALTMSLNFYFTAGEYRGSSLCVIGRNPISKTSREMPVVGGTGIFRMAQGYCISTTHSYDAATNYGILLSQKSSSLYSTPPVGYPLFCSLPLQESLEGVRIDRAATSSSIFLSRKSSKMAKLGKINSVVKAIKGNTTDEERFRNMLKAKEKVIKIHFYVQDALGGSNPTVWEVARSPQTSTSPTTFGQVRVIDDLVTTGPDRNSEKLGRAQGIITFSDLNESALTMNLNFYFTAGEYKGSSLCVVGRNPIPNKNRELPIVGGTGIFRMSRGYSISNTYSYDTVTNYGILEYTLYVAYVDQDQEEEEEEELSKGSGK